MRPESRRGEIACCPRCSTLLGAAIGQSGCPECGYVGSVVVRPWESTHTPVFQSARGEDALRIGRDAWRLELQSRRARVERLTDLTER